MALIDDINALPITVSDGNTGHLNNHQVIHAALKDHETRLGARHLIGTGSPEGRITATIGTQYTDQAATYGAIRWNKTSGTGATGWMVEYGDTGWRDVTDMVKESSSAVTLDAGARVMIRRTSSSIIVRLTGTITAASTFGNLFPVTQGFRTTTPTETALARGVTLRNTRSWVRMEDASSGVILAKINMSTETSWTPEPLWPTSLPGTPA